MVQTDPESVSDAIAHFLDNAVKYTRKGGIIVSLRKSGDRANLTIQDSGSGISREYLPVIFEPFTQESEGFTKKYQGIGLGLALAKRYLDAVGAELDIQSEKDKGTTITIAFPV